MWILRAATKQEKCTSQVIDSKGFFLPSMQKQWLVYYEMDKKSNIYQKFKTKKNLICGCSLEGTLDHAEVGGGGGGCGGGGPPESVTNVVGGFSTIRPCVPP